MWMRKRMQRRRHLQWGNFVLWTICYSNLWLVVMWEWLNRELGKVQLWPTKKWMWNYLKVCARLFLQFYRVYMLTWWMQAWLWPLDVGWLRSMWMHFLGGRLWCDRVLPARILVRHWWSMCLCSERWMWCLNVPTLGALIRMRVLYEGHLWLHRNM
jgi:hypothetical protein